MADAQHTSSTSVSVHDFWASKLNYNSCSSLAILLLDVFTTNAGRLGVSQTLNITYHAPALPYAS
jgi:hypothetical protein